MDALKIYLNGSFVPEHEARISIFDHGLLYGDGVFEGIRAYNGRVFKLTEHVARLYCSAKAIALDIPISPDDFAVLVLEACRTNGLHDAYIRPIVTRGVGDFGLDPRKCNEPTVIIAAKPFPRLYGDAVYDRGLKAIVASARRTPPDCLSPNIKSLNYLNNILARIEANQRGADEAILLDTRGFVSEASADNLFTVSGGVLVTPPTYNSLQGITRAAVIELAKQERIPFRELPLTLFDVYNADEVFITGTAAEVAPIVDVDGRTIGDGRPGAITRRLTAAFQRYVRESGTPIYTGKTASAAVA